MSETPTDIPTFKAWAAQAAHRGSNRVYRWYARRTGCGQCYELDCWSEMLQCHRDGWKLHKEELKTMGFSVVKDGPNFMFIVNADNAEKWLTEGLEHEIRR